MTKQVIPLYPAEGSTFAKTYLSAGLTAGRWAAYEESLGFTRVRDPSVCQLELRFGMVSLRLGSVKDVVAILIFLRCSLKSESIGS